MNNFDLEFENTENYQTESKQCDCGNPIYKDASECLSCYQDHQANS